MAFTIHELEAAIAKADIHDISSKHHFSTNPNRKIVFDFLTGASDSLQGIDIKQFDVPLSFLMDLLISIENPVENDRLLLNVAIHQDLFGTFEHKLLHWVALKLTQNDSDSLINATVALLQKADLSSTEIVSLLLFHLQPYHNRLKTGIKEDSPLDNFLVTHLPDIAEYNRNHSSFSCNNWNELFFVLLDRANSRQAEQYLVGCLSSHCELQLQQLLAFEDGRYAGIISAWIRVPSSTQHELSAKFHRALSLYHLDNGQFEQLLVQASRNYLHDYPLYFGKAGQEQTGSINGQEMCYSAIAAFVTLQHSPEFAKSTVRDWLQKELFVHEDVYRVMDLRIGELV